LAKLRLTSIGLEKFELLSEAKLAFVLITQDDFKKSGANWDDTEFFFSFLIGMPTVIVSAIIKEKPKGGVKVSLRSKSENRDNIGVHLIAKEFGGGGHFHAAGFESDINYNVLKNQLIDTIKKYIKE